ncbi:MAG: hypothetical protein HYZ57_14470 [Acidobacteria bacterium]|nr:hypothetical protein [Acidobacteriota bacterium]MBI3281037.1 hypothetical protein [Acidobacteriota bacterium]
MEIEYLCTSSYVGVDSGGVGDDNDIVMDVTGRTEDIADEVQLRAVIRRASGRQKALSTLGRATRTLFSGLQQRLPDGLITSIQSANAFAKSETYGVVTVTIENYPRMEEVSVKITGH